MKECYGILGVRLNTAVVIIKFYILIWSRDQNRQSFRYLNKGLEGEVYNKKFIKSLEKFNECLIG